MFGDYFYHESLRKIVVAFGTIFNNINIQRKDSSGNVVQSIKVPLAYSPKEKFIARLDQQPDLVEDRRVAVTLPRMGFEITGSILLEGDTTNYLINEDYAIQTQQPYADNSTFESDAGFGTTSTSDDILDFTERNPFGEVDEGF